MFGIFRMGLFYIIGFFSGVLDDVGVFVGVNSLDSLDGF